MHVKNEALRLIEEYNLDVKHYKLTPRETFGEECYSQFFFYADYSPKPKEKKTIGFKQGGEDFFGYNSEGRLIKLENVDKAIENLSLQLANIPKL